MDDWFNALASVSELPSGAVQDLHEVGFAVIPGVVAGGKLAQLARAYDSAVASAQTDDVATGSTTTRINDFVNRAPEFDEFYIFSPLLEACCRIIGRPFKLSTMHARTLRPRAPAQSLHVDFERDLEGWPMVGFILMVDAFRADNGATRFVPGSHKWMTTPESLMRDRQADYPGQVLTCDPAGSMIVFNGSVWHGHTANASGEARRSIQGAFIRREARPGIDLPARMRPETLARIGTLGKYVLAV